MRKRTSIDDLPGEPYGRSAILEAAAPPRVDAAHRLEHAVKRRLLSHPALHFSSLVIRRIPNGVCLEGVLESEGSLDVCNVVRGVAGVDEVLNHLVVRRPVVGGC